MRGLLRSLLKRECQKLISRHDEYLRDLDESTKRKARRLGSVVDKEIRRPSYWSLDPRFDPFKTRSRQKLDLYSYTLARKIRDHTYRPECAVTHRVPKEGSEDRELAVFQLPDAAVSLSVYYSLLHKNISRLSGHAYAYRSDRGAHDAVHDVASEWRNRDRVYVAEFDFSRFFDNIDHHYLRTVLNRQNFLYTPEEEHIVRVFLESETATQADYLTGSHTQRVKGIPQGSAISLILANLACWELDRALERVGVGFCRYADDTLLWSDSYDKVVRAYDTIYEYSIKMGVPINPTKSPGISLVHTHERAEICAKRSVDYLGYRISCRHVSIKEARVAKIKEKISYLLYSNLLQPLHADIYNDSRLGELDWDYYTALLQLRRYLYGGLTDEKLARYIRGQIPDLHFRGLMSYYPLVDDDEQLSSMDAWLRHVLRQSLRRRERLWRTHTGCALPGPRADWVEDVTHLGVWEDSGGQTYDLRVPSFLLINRAMRLALRQSGISAVTNPQSSYY